MEQLTNPTRMETAFQAAVEIGIPVINCGRGKSDDEASFQQTLESLGSLAHMAEKYGVILCVKAHVGGAIYNAPPPSAQCGQSLPRRSVSIWIHHTFTVPVRTRSRH